MRWRGMGIMILYHRDDFHATYTSADRGEERRSQLESSSREKKGEFSRARDQQHTALTGQKKKKKKKKKFFSFSQPNRQSALSLTFVANPEFQGIHHEDDLEGCRSSYIEKEILVVADELRSLRCRQARSSSTLSLVGRRDNCLLRFVLASRSAA